MTASTSADQRSGPRIPIKVPVVLEGRDTSNQPVHEETETLLVNEAGALLALSAEMQLQERARVTNRTSGAVSDCRIAWRSAGKINNRWSYGIALLGTPDDFWEIGKQSP